MGNRKSGTFLAALTIAFGAFFGANAAKPALAAGIDELAAAAKKEGSVVWYSTLGPEQNTRVVSAFEKRYGVKVQVHRAPTGVMTQRYLAERESGRVVADLLSISTEQVYENLTKDGTFAKINDRDVPALAAWPKNAFRFESTAIIIAQIYGFAYNTDLLKDGEIPRKFEDLLRPAYKGKMTFPKWDASPLYNTVLKMWQDKYGDQYIKALAQQNPGSYESVVTALQSLAAGEYAIVPLAPSPFVPPIVSAGAPVKYIIPPTTTGNEIFMAVSAKAPHPMAARLFMNFMLTKEGQEIFNGKDGASMLPGTDTLQLPEGYVLPEFVSAEKVKELHGLIQSR